MGCGKFDLAKSAFGWKVDGSSRLREWGFSEGIDSEGKWDAVTSGRDTPAGPYMAFLEGRGLRQIHLEDMRRRELARPFDTWPTPLPEDAYADNWVAAHALRLISGAPGNRPWFLQVNFLGPHDPWDITAEMAGLYRNQEFVLPTGVAPKDVEAHQAVRRHYAAMIENIDRWIGVILDLLKVSGQLGNTLIVVSSDHGEMLGDRGIWGKSVPLQPSVQVPLVVAGPGVSAGIVIPNPTTILDLAGTFADFAGAPTIPGWDSRSLRRQLADPSATPRRSHVFSALPQWQSVFDGRYKLVEFHDRLILRDLKEDPDETIDVAESNPQTVQRLSTLLRERGAGPSR
jgi:arylsulfatase A-like enzyme